ncbi:MAG TPA: HEAT repeat domain-containing protein [bacterium]|nr:HEAT repeat domain-containing protein [bacterium]
MLATLAALAASASLRAQDEHTPAAGKPSTPKKLTEWPALDKTVRRRVRALVKDFRKKPELHGAAADKLVAIGAGAVPVLIPMVNDRPDGINDQLFGVIDRLTGPPHAALLAREIRRPSVALRRHLMRRFATFHDPELAPVLTKALKDKDPEIAYYAALALLGIGNLDGLDRVLDTARQRWSESRDLIAAVLPAARSRTTGNAVLERIALAKPTEQMAGLRLLRYLMVKDQRVMLRHYLESSDFAVKREAINCARVVHGEKPLEKLSSFQAINMAKEWLGKL